MMEIGRKYGSDGSYKDITFEIYDYVRDLRTLLDDIYNTFEQSWEASFEKLCEFVYVEAFKGINIDLMNFSAGRPIE